MQRIVFALAPWLARHATSVRRWNCTHRKRWQLAAVFSLGIIGGLFAPPTHAGVICRDVPFYNYARFVSTDGKPGQWFFTGTTYYPECERTFENNGRNGRNQEGGGGGGGGGGGDEKPPGAGRELDGNQGVVNEDGLQPSTSTGPSCGNPVLLATGNKVERETDFATSGEMPLFLERVYNKHYRNRTLFGHNWLSNFDYRLSFGHYSSLFTQCYAAPGWAQCGNAASLNEAWAHRPDGRMIKFVKGADGIYREDKPSPISTLTLQADGTWLLRFEDNLTELYSPGGFPQWIQDEHGLRWTFTYDGLNGTQLKEVTHTSGRKVQFTWDGDELRTIRDPAGNAFTFNYTFRSQIFDWQTLKSVVLPGLPATTITYHYTNEPGEAETPAAGLSGKSFNGVRYSWFSYVADEYNMYGATTEHANGVERHSFGYSTNPAGHLIVSHTNPLNRQTTYEFDGGKLLAVHGLPAQHCPEIAKNNDYDANGFLDHSRDFGGNVTDFDYNAKGQLQQRIEGAGSLQARRTAYTWDGANNRVASVSISDAAGTPQTRTDYHYTTDARLASVTLTNLSPNVAATQNQTRTTTYSYTYHPNGMVATATTDGPLASDTRVLRYDSLGNLLEDRDGIGAKTTYANHDAMGRAGRITGPNGAVEEVLYDARGRVKETRKIIGGVSWATLYAYDGFGRLTSIQRPDGRTTTRQYDPAWRITREYEPAPGGLFDVVNFAYNNASLVTSVRTERTSALDPPTQNPVLSLPSQAAYGNYTVSWGAIGGTEYYLLEERPAAGAWTMVLSGTSLQHQVQGKAAGTYEYRAQACNAAGCTAPSALAAVVAVYPPTGTPVASSPTAQPVTNGSYSIAWTAVATADRYRVEESVNGGGWATLTPDSVELTRGFSGRSAGTYSYRVSGCNVANCGPTSNVVTIQEIDPPGAPALSAPGASYTGTYNVTWGAVSGAAYYQFYERKNGGSWSIVTEYGTSKLLSGRTDGIYEYMLYACNGAGCSGASAIVAVTVTLPPSFAPSLSASASQVTNGAFSLSWTAVAGASGYELEESFNGGGWVLLFSQYGFSWGLSGKPAGTYTYRVRACNVAGCGPLSAQVVVTEIDPPGAPTISAPSYDNDGTYSVTWSQPPTSTTYQLEESVNGGAFNLAYSGANNYKSYTRRGVGRFTYRVKACNAAGCGGYSPNKTVEVANGCATCRSAATDVNSQSVLAVIKEEAP